MIVRGDCPLHEPMHRILAVRELLTLMETLEVAVTVALLQVLMVPSAVVRLARQERCHHTSQQQWHQVASFLEPHELH